jgi:hypothetical protein
VANDEQFPDFDGWTVERKTADDGTPLNHFVFNKPHPGGKDGNLHVRITGGVDADPAMVYERGVRDCYAEDVRVSPPDDVSLWQGKFDAADRAVTLRKVRNGLAAGYGESYAFDRLRAAGFTAAEIAAVLEG